MQQTGDLFLVENAASRLRISPIDRAPLPELVERAYGLGPFLALWAVEGLGHVYGENALGKTAYPCGLLTSPVAESVRPGSLLMLHAGIGLAFAQHLLEKVTPATALQPVISEFVTLCQENSLPGYVGAAYESLGLVTRSFHELMVPWVDRALRQSFPELVGYFWHGAGRATYFLPRYFIPSRDFDVLGLAAFAPDQTARLNVISGLAWAFTLVNMRQPAIMLTLLSRQCDTMRRNPAFGNGFRSSIIMRHDTTPGSEIINLFCKATSSVRDNQSSAASFIGNACLEALDRVYPVLLRSKQLGKVFQFEDLDALAGLTADRREGV